MVDVIRITKQSRNFEDKRIMNEDESDGDPKFITTIRFGGKLLSHWKTNRKQSWKWRGVCRAYKNPMLESDVGETSFKNKGKTCMA